MTDAAAQGPDGADGLRSRTTTARRSFARRSSTTRLTTAPTDWSATRTAICTWPCGPRTGRAFASTRPTGKELAYIKTEVPTNVGFGRGDDGRPALHHRRQEPVSHQVEQPRLPPARDGKTLSNAAVVLLASSCVRVLCGSVVVNHKGHEGHKDGEGRSRVLSAL